MPGEFDMIRRYLAPLSVTVPGAYSLTDDAAVLPARAGLETVVTMDTLVSGVHFMDGTKPEYIAAKAVRVNLSDLAAMAAEPEFYAMSLSLPKLGDDWLERFCEALAVEQKIFGISLIGGDTVSTPGPLSLTITAIGYVEPGREARRSTAGAGDLVVVSGFIGDAAFGLAALKGELAGLSKPSFEILSERHNRPQPQLELGRRLGSFASAVIDVSDGLVQDLGHICAASGLSAVIELEKIPVSPAFGEAMALVSCAKIDVLCGGDDYQLLFTIPPAGVSELNAIARECRVNLTVIGKMQQDSLATDATMVNVIDSEGLPVVATATGFRHF